MVAFSNVPIVVMWTFVRNRMLPQIKQQQLEPYCNWYYYFFLFRVLFKDCYLRDIKRQRNEQPEFHESTFYEFILCDLLKMLLFFKFKHSIKFRATWLRISGDMIMNFGQHDFGFERHDFGRLDRKPTLTYVFRSIVSSVSLALSGISFNRLLPQYPTHSKKSLSIDCFISISRSSRNFFQSIVPSVPLALQGISFNRLLRQYLSLSKEFLSIDCYVSTSRSPRNFFQSIVTSVPLALQGISFNRLFRQYPSHP